MGLRRFHLGGSAQPSSARSSARDSPLPPSQPVTLVAVVEGNVSDPSSDGLVVPTSLVDWVTADEILVVRVRLRAQGFPAEGKNPLAETPDCGVCALCQPIRLETRTKEFNMCASHWVL